MATTPPFRKLPSAAITTSPLGANVTARSSSTCGFAVSLPTHFAPSDAASFRCDSPRVPCAPEIDAVPHARRVNSNPRPTGSATQANHPNSIAESSSSRMGNARADKPSPLAVTTPVASLRSVCLHTTMYNIHRAADATLSRRAPLESASCPGPRSKDDDLSAGA